MPTISMVFIRLKYIMDFARAGSSTPPIPRRRSYALGFAAMSSTATQEGGGKTGID
ncbi:MAG TPA: hypothetical protein VHO91_20630 [Rhodopila sp.]|nr:hypothetical protein [Rhodopila sp.]